MNSRFSVSVIDRLGKVPMKEVEQGVFLLERSPEKGALKFGRAFNGDPIHVSVTATKNDGRKQCLFSGRDSEKQPAGEVLMKRAELTAYCSGPKTTSSYNGPSLAMSNNKEIIVSFHPIGSADGRKAAGVTEDGYYSGLRGSHPGRALATVTLRFPAETNLIETEKNKVLAAAGT